MTATHFCLQFFLAAERGALAADLTSQKRGRLVVGLSPLAAAFAQVGLGPALASPNCPHSPSLLIGPLEVLTEGGLAAPHSLLDEAARHTCYGAPLLRSLCSRPKSLFFVFTFPSVSFPGPHPYHPGRVLCVECDLTSAFPGRKSSGVSI